MIKRMVSFIYKNIYSYKSIKQFNTLKNRDFSNIESIKEYQIKKLFKVLGVAFTKNPYYMDLKGDFESNTFTYENFQRIPILTKDSIREEVSRMSNNHFLKMNEVYANTSGGSTGEPVKFFQTKEQAQYGIANYYYALHLNNVNIYSKSVDLWGAQRDMHDRSTVFNIRSYIHNKTTLNTFVWSNAIMNDYISRLNSIKPQFIKAYVHSIYDLSKYINKYNIQINFKPVIHCTTGPLYPEMREEIKKAFNEADVYNFYGSREVSAIATEVAGYNGLQVLFDNVFVEILDESNLPVKKGMEGQVVITTLNNHYMPLIRYRIGDRAIKGDDVAFGTLKLDKVVGRTLGVIHKKDGSKIDGQFFTRLFFDKKGIKKFQLIQKSISELELKIVKTENYNQEELDTILKIINKELINVNINIAFYDELALTGTGKIMYVYSEI